jgi:translocation and assembly module TamB
MHQAGDEDRTDEVEPGPFRGRRLKRWIFGTVALLMIALLGIAYWQRITIANRFVERELQARGIRASYTIEEIGLRTQRLRNVVIGDPANPDLTARLVEIDIALNFSGANMRDVRASGVRVKGGVSNGRLSFGDLDKFSDPASKAPFEWPDIGLVLRDAAARIDTPWGVVGATLEGKGLLRNRFVGDLSIRVPQLAYGDCRMPDMRFDGDLLLEWQQPRLVGPVTAQSAACTNAGFAVDAPVLNADVRLSERFDRWLGDVGFSAQAVRYAGSVLTMPQGTLSVDGGIKRTNFGLALERGGLRSKPLTLAQLSIDATGYAGWNRGAFGAAASGGARVRRGALDKGTLGSLSEIVRQSRDTPIGPLLARMAPVLESAGDNFDGQMDFDLYQNAQRQSGLAISDLALTTASGARVRQSGELSLRARDNVWTIASPVRLTINGRNLPDTALQVEQSRGGNWAGNLVIAPYAASGASLAVPDFSFAGRPGGAWSFAGEAKLSGPLPGGAISGLILPLDGRYDGRGLTLYDDCRNFRFDSARMSSLMLRGQNVRLCPDPGQSMLTLRGGNMRLVTNISNLATAGMLGGAPMTANSAHVRFSLADGFAARDVKVTLGDASAQTRFDVAMLAGQFGNGVAGTLSGGSGQIGNVPLLIDEAAGNWRYLNSVLTLDSRLRVSDAADVDRFQPMTVPDMMLTLENNMITAIGAITEPETARKVADVDIRHALGNSSGRALLSVDGLRFDEMLQPEMLTPLSLGVVANVDGSVFGDGRIEWDADGVKSNGRFATRGMNLAAAFGPVEGLTTEIMFSDLLGLETGPGQQATLASVNPGIPALGGMIGYQLLPGQRIAIEAGRWPFAGGELILEPTILDFGIEADRRLTFRVIGVDAEKFLAGYDFQNLRVTGVFDGTLPMVFDQDGGRIVGGALVSRPGGGEVSYLGELSYENMGTLANFAFEALRSIRYSSLTLGVGGNLDGEIVTDISFTGLQQGTGARRNFLTSQIARIPIKFNVTVKAEFLKLIGSIRGLYDAQYAADQALPFLIQQRDGPAPVTGEEPSGQKDEPQDE